MSTPAQIGAAGSGTTVEASYRYTADVDSNVPGQGIFTPYGSMSFTATYSYQ